MRFTGGLECGAADGENAAVLMRGSEECDQFFQFGVNNYEESVPIVLRVP
jgi:hypothetical protein